MTWIRDIIGLAGLGLFGYGAWLIYQPAAWIAVGVILMAVAYKGAK